MSSNSGRLFLVIGAMKAGTTSLYHDLSQLEDVGTNPTKEPDLFTHARSDTKIRRDVCRFLSGNSGWLGDFSTSYTMAGLYPDVPERAYRILGDDVPILYLVRNPVLRAISHHHHWLARGITSHNIDQAFRDDPAFLDVSSYGHQLRLWEEVFGSEKAHVIVFEDYIAQREKVVQRIAGLLGVPAPSSPTSQTAHNTNAGGRVASGLVGELVSSRSYRLFARQVIPASLRRGVGSYLLKDAGARQYPSASTLHWFCDALRPDLELITRKLQSEKAPWDLDATVNELVEKRER